MIRVKELLKEKKMLLLELANELGITRQALNRIQKGNIRISTAERIATVLDIPLWRLFASDEEVLKDLQRRHGNKFYCRSCGEPVDLTTFECQQ